MDVFIGRAIIPSHCGRFFSVNRHTFFLREADLTLYHISTMELSFIIPTANSPGSWRGNLGSNGFFYSEDEDPPHCMLSVFFFVWARLEIMDFFYSEGDHPSTVGWKQLYNGLCNPCHGFFFFFLVKAKVGGAPYTRVRIIPGILRNILISLHLLI